MQRILQIVRQDREETGPWPRSTRAGPRSDDNCILRSLQLQVGRDAREELRRLNGFVT